MKPTVYILASGKKGTFYIAEISNLIREPNPTWQHLWDEVSGA